MVELLLLTSIININTPIFTSGPKNPTHKPTDFRYVDNRLSKYVESFEEKWGKKIGFRVTFGEMSDEYAGYCQIYPLKRKIIVINQESFDYYNESQKEVLLYHELGHCALYKKHNNNLRRFKGFNGIYPESVMYDKVFNSVQIKVYDKYKRHYHKDLLNERR